MMDSIYGWFIKYSLNTACVGVMLYIYPTLKVGCGVCIDVTSFALSLPLSFI